MGDGNLGHTSALYVWNGISLFWGTSFHTDPHAHNTLQLVFDLDKSFKLRDAQSDWQAHSAAVIREGHRHQLDSCGSIQLFIYLDPESRYAKALKEKYLQDAAMATIERAAHRKLSNQFFRKLLLNSDCERLLAACQTIFEELIAIPPLRAVDERVLKAIRFISQHPDKQFKVCDVANHVCLSESRMRHLFKEQVGQPIQNFMLWMKVVDSLNMVLQGKQVTQSAIDAGFWDRSHMNRSYKHLLGIVPGKISTFEKHLRIVACQRGNLHTLRTTVFDQWDQDTPEQTIEL